MTARQLVAAEERAEHARRRLADAQQVFGEANAGDRTGERR